MALLGGGRAGCCAVSGGDGDGDGDGGDGDGDGGEISPRTERGREGGHVTLCFGSVIFSPSDSVPYLAFFFFLFIPNNYFFSLSIELNFSIFF